MVRKERTRQLHVRFLRLSWLSLPVLASTGRCTGRSFLCPLCSQPCPRQVGTERAQKEPRQCNCSFPLPVRRATDNGCKIRACRDRQVRPPTVFFCLFSSQRCYLRMPIEKHPTNGLHRFFLRLRKREDFPTVGDFSVHNSYKCLHYKSRI